MGRPEKPVARQTRALGRLALGLRAARHQAKLSYRDLAAKSGFSRPVLQRAASGDTIPTKDVIQAYANACGIDPAPLLTLRETAKASQDQTSRGPRTRPPSVRQIRDEADMGAALGKVHRSAGSPTYREIDQRTQSTAGIMRVNKTTVHLILSRQRFPSSRAQLQALLVVHEVPATQHREWMRAWSRVDRIIQAERRANRARRAKLKLRITQTPSPHASTYQPQQPHPAQGRTPPRGEAGRPSPESTTRRTC